MKILLFRLILFIELGRIKKVFYFAILSENKSRRDVKPSFYVSLIQDVHVHMTSGGAEFRPRKVDSTIPAPGKE